MASSASFHVLSFTGADAEVRPHQKRKFHSKVRSGCVCCRLKKVKCDEAKPVCLRCRRNVRQCVYEVQGAGSSPPQAPSLRVRDGGISNLSSVTVSPFSRPGRELGTSCVYLTQHLWTQWGNIFPFSRGPEIERLFRSDELVRSVLFALSASHLRHVSSGYLQHRIAEHFQQFHALESYKRRLYTPMSKLSQDSVNGLITSASLLNVLAFSLPEPDATTVEGDLNTESSWLFSPREDRLGWLALQTGLRPLFLSTAEHLEKGIKFLGQVFLGEETNRWTFSRLVKTLEGVPEHWIEFFELYHPSSGCECAGDYDVYRAPATIIATTRNFESTPVNVFRTQQFLGKLQGEFRELIYHRDERALWLFGYWLGIMCRFKGMWWCERRVQRDYRAICLWLCKLRVTQRPGREGQLWGIMMDELQSATHPIQPSG